MPANYQQLAHDAAVAAGIPPDLFMAQIRQESGFNPRAGSSAGAQGIAQIMPATARGWGVDPWNPRQALYAAASHMADYSRKYGGYRNALIAYNAGPGMVGKPLYAETRNYIARIMGGGKGASLYPQRKPARAKGFIPGVDAAGSDDADALNFIMQGSPFEGMATSLAPRKAPAFAAPGGLGSQAPGKTTGILGLARSEVGTTAAQAMKYIRAAGGTGNEPWCGDFVQYLFRKRGLPVPPARSVPGLLAWARKNHRYANRGTAGSLVMFDWNHDGVPDHVGVVTGTANGHVQTIEGNTSGARGSGVYTKNRSLSDILGYVNA